jgi:glyoxylase I family protein
MKILDEVPASFTHVSIIVADVERSRQFYGDVLKMQEDNRPDFGFPGIWYNLGNGLQLHIIHNADLVRPKDEIESFTPQYAHFALFTDQVDELYERFKDRQVNVNELYSSPTKMRQIFVKDPDGNMVEFIGPSKAY